MLSPLRLGPTSERSANRLPLPLQASFAHVHSASSSHCSASTFIGHLRIAPLVTGQSLHPSLICSPCSHTLAVGQHPSHGVSFPSAHEVPKVHSTRICLTRYVPLSGFFSLLGGYSSRYPPALFHAVNARGILPSGLLPPVGYGTLSGLVTFLSLEARDASVMTLPV